MYGMYKLAFTRWRLSLAMPTWFPHKHGRFEGMGQWLHAPIPPFNLHSRQVPNKAETTKAWLQSPGPRSGSVDPGRPTDHHEGADILSSGSSVWTAPG